MPACYRADATADGTVLVLEDLSAWQPGADPAIAAHLLSGMHRAWDGQASSRWPWLRRPDDAADLVGALYDRLWPVLTARRDLTAQVRSLGERLVGRFPRRSLP